MRDLSDRCVCLVVWQALRYLGVIRGVGVVSILSRCSRVRVFRSLGVLGPNKLCGLLVVQEPHLESGLMW